MRLFKDERKNLHLMHPALTALIACVNTALNEPKSPITIRAGKKGLSVSLDGHVICKGSDLSVFAANWKQKQDAAIAAATVSERTA